MVGFVEKAKAGGQKPHHVCEKTEFMKKVRVFKALVQNIIHWKFLLFCTFLHHGVGIK